MIDTWEQTVRYGFHRTVWPMTTTCMSFSAAAGLTSTHEHTVALKIVKSWVPAIRLLLGAVGCFSAAWLVARLVGLILAARGGEARRVPKLLQEVISAALFLATVIGSIALISDQPLLGAVATSSVLIAIFGFVLRNVIADAVSRLALGQECSYRIGDWLEIDGGITGQVIEINWRTTRLLTRDQTHTILPNSRIAQLRLINYSAPWSSYRGQLTSVLDHVIPVQEAKHLLDNPALSAPIILGDRKPDVRALSYEISGITYAVRYWIPSHGEEVDCRDAILSAIDTAQRAAGFPPPRTRMMAELDQVIGSDRPIAQVQGLS